MPAALGPLGRSPRLRRFGRLALEVTTLRHYAGSEMHRSRGVLVVATLLLLVASGCRRRAVREWRPDDHDEENTSTQAAPTFQTNGGGPSNPEEEARTLVEAAWGTNCAVCHGRFGQGDGPQGALVHASNLTDPNFQARASDEQIAATIRNGKNKMPAFPALPEAVVKGLVARIRTLKAP